MSLLRNVDRPAVLDIGALADAFHYTPQEIDDMEQGDRLDLLSYAAAKSRVEHEIFERAKGESDTPRKRNGMSVQQFRAANGLPSDISDEDVMEAMNPDMSGEWQDFSEEEAWDG